MKVIIVKTGVKTDVNDEYGARLIEQGVAQIAAEPEKKAAAPEKKAETPEKEDEAPEEKPAKPEKKK